MNVPINFARVSTFPFNLNSTLRRSTQSLLLMDTALRCMHAYFLLRGSFSSLLSRCKSIRGLYDACTIKPRQLKGLQSLAISLRRVDVATDLSWLENILASTGRANATQGGGCRPHPQPQSWEGGAAPSRKHDGDICDSVLEGISPHTAEDTRGGTTAEHERGPGRSEGTPVVKANDSSGSVKEGVTNSSIERTKMIDAHSVRESSAGPDGSEKLGASKISKGLLNTVFGNPIISESTSGVHAQHAEKMEADAVAVATTEAIGGKPAGMETSTWSDSTTTPPSSKPPVCTATPPPAAAFAATLDARLVPLYATLSVGVFTLVCNDDRAKKKDDGRSAVRADHKSAAGLGKLEILVGASNDTRAWDLGRVEPGVATPTTATAAVAGGVKPEESSLQNHALTMSWETMTAATSDTDGGPRSTAHIPALPESMVLGLARLKLESFFRRYFARRLVRCSVPTGGRASARLSEMRIQCRPRETVAERGDEQSPTSLWCVVARNVSAVPVIVVVQQKQKQEYPVSLHLPKSEHIGGGGGGCGSDGGRKIERWPCGHSDDDDAAAPFPRKTPPMLPPRPHPLQLTPPRWLQRFLRILRRFRRWGWRRAPRERKRQVCASPGVARFQVPEVKVHASAVTGGVNAGLAGWLNLRGLHEAQGLVATELRIAKLIAAGEGR